ncbi:MAG: helix-hairpin-helix domain-containing protein [Bacilli bacterium]|nr:helix-hairpin-helix domain-containing protein [Bacilli bacterium]
MKLIRKLKYPITIILFILIILYVIYIKNNLNNSKYENIVIENDILKEETDVKDEEDIIKYNVDIKGAIKNPGVYQVDSNLTVNDVIDIAGGLTKDADTSVINLAKKITDEMVIIIYTKEEVKNSNIVDTVIKVVEKECVCPNIQNDGCLNTEIKDNITNSENNNLVNINTATKEELQTIKGIGESKADSIIKYREQNGNFKTIEDIKNVEGIGDTLYETIKIYLTT